MRHSHLSFYEKDGLSPSLCEALPCSPAIPKCYSPLRICPHNFRVGCRYRNVASTFKSQLWPLSTAFQSFSQLPVYTIVAFELFVNCSKINMNCFCFSLLANASCASRILTEGFRRRCRFRKAIQCQLYILNFHFLHLCQPDLISYFICRAH